MNIQILLYSLCSSAGMYVICYFWFWPGHHKWILGKKQQSNKAQSNEEMEQQNMEQQRKA
jgi:hypothetical protein